MYIISYKNDIPDHISIPNPIHILLLEYKNRTGNANIGRIDKLSGPVILWGKHLTKRD